MRKLITARARKNKRTARMLANAREDHSIPLSLVGTECLLFFVFGDIYQEQNIQSFQIWWNYVNSCMASI